MPNFTLLETSQRSLDSGPTLVVLSAPFCANQKMPVSCTPQVCQKGVLGLQVRASWSDRMSELGGALVTITMRRVIIIPV